jgi:hypothetical protein
MRDALAKLIVGCLKGGAVLRWLTLIMLLLSGTFAAERTCAQTRPGLGAPLPESAFSPLQTGSAEAAFADGPLQLSPNALRILRARFPGDKVPIIPQPFRQQLDAALVARDWSRVMERKRDLGASRGQIAMLMWEQTRMLATGSLWLAELQSRDLADSDIRGAGDTAVMLWLYAVAVTMTDSHECAADDARDTHLALLRSNSFAPVLALLRKMPDDQLMKLRDTAIKLEAALAPERNEDTVCRTGSAKPAIRPTDEWHTAAAQTRELLTRHLNAICALVRGRPMGVPATAVGAPNQAPPR